MGDIEPIDRTESIQFLKAAYRLFNYDADKLHDFAVFSFRGETYEQFVSFTGSQFNAIEKLAFLEFKNICIKLTMTNRRVHFALELALEQMLVYGH